MGGGAVLGTTKGGGFKGSGGLELGLTVKADRLPVTSPLRATLAKTGQSSPGARSDGSGGFSDNEDLDACFAGEGGILAPAAVDEAPPPPAAAAVPSTEAERPTTAIPPPLDGETFVQSLRLTPTHVANLEAGGFLLLKKKPTATAIYQVSVAAGPTDVDPKDHCTLSLNGVTVVTHGDAAFSTLARFEHEFEIFKAILRSIPFFRRFRLWKQFTVWKKGVRRGKMSNVAQALNKSIRFLPTMVPALTAVHGHCDDVENQRLIQGLPGATGSAAAAAAKGGGEDVAALTPPFKLERFLTEQETVRIIWFKVACMV
jgi:hypothetical protein